MSSWSALGEAMTKAIHPVIVISHIIRGKLSAVYGRDILPVYSLA
jgi:hypothetical protein